MSPIRYPVIEADYTKQQLAISNCAPTWAKIKRVPWASRIGFDGEFGEGTQSYVGTARVRYAR
jgi:hypothetical protein